MKQAGPGRRDGSVQKVAPSAACLAPVPFVAVHSMRDEQHSSAESGVKGFGSRRPRTSAGVTSRSRAASESWLGSHKGQRQAWQQVCLRPAVSCVSRVPTPCPIPAYLSATSDPSVPTHR